MNFSAIPRKSFLGRLLRLPLKLLPANLVMPVLQGPMQGTRWIVGSGDHGYWLGSYELTNQQLLASEVQPGNVVFDIGAHVGYFTLLAARLVGPEGFVHAFEPHPQNVEFIERHIHLNKLENVGLHPIAVSKQSGNAYFGDGVSSSTGHLSPGGDLEVKTSSLDDLLGSDTVKPPQLIKIDVEGGEVDVLTGGIETLKQVRPTIFFATHGADQHQSCIDLLDSLAYTLQPVNAEQVEYATEILALPR